MVLSMGAIGSLIAWGIVNLIFVPKFECSELLYADKSKPYIKIWNKSYALCTAYEVICFAVFYNRNNKILYTKREEIIKLDIGSLSKNVHFIKLTKEMNIDENLFSAGNTIKVEIVGHNRFGVKQYYTKNISIVDIEDKYADNN